MGDHGIGNIGEHDAALPPPSGPCSTTTRSIRGEGAVTALYLLGEWHSGSGKSRIRRIPGSGKNRVRALPRSRMPFANARIGLKPHPGVAAVANARIGLKPRSWKKHGSKIIPAEAGSPLCQFCRVSPGGLFPCCICPRIVVLTRSWVERMRRYRGFNPILGRADAEVSWF